MLGLLYSFRVLDFPRHTKLHEIRLIFLRLAFNLFLAKASLNLRLIRVILSLQLRQYVSYSLSWCPNNTKSLYSGWWKCEIFPALCELWICSVCCFPMILSPASWILNPCMSRLLYNQNWHGGCFSDIWGVCTFSLSLPLYLPPSLPLSFSFSHTLPANSTFLSHPKLQFLYIWVPYFLLSPINCLQAVGWGNCQVHLFIFFSEIIGIFITKWLKIVVSYILSNYLIIYGGV